MTRKTVTIHSVAKKAGVSISTVSNVINKKGNIPTSTRKRVLTAMKELNYIPNPLAQRLVTKKTNIISLIIPSIDNPWFAGLYNGVQKFIDTNFPTYRIFVGNTNYSIEREIQLIEMYIREYAEGYIIVSNNPTSKEKKELYAANIPIIFAINDVNEVFDNYLVTYNNFDLEYDVTKQLIELGHTRFAYIAGVFDESSRAKARFKGFETCLADHDIKFDDRYFVKGCDYSIDSAFKSADRILSERPLPTAICCANDVIAFGALAAIRKHGITVPQGMSIVGFDDIAMSQYMSPALTTCSVSPSDIGFEAAKMLFSVIQKKRIRNKCKVIKGTVIIRDSCAVPRD